MSGKAQVLKPRGIVDRSLVARARDLLFDQAPECVRFLGRVRDGEHDELPPAVVRNRIRAAVAVLERTVPSVSRVEHRALVEQLAPAADEKRVEADAEIVPSAQVEAAAVDELMRRRFGNGTNGTAH